MAEPTLGHGKICYIEIPSTDVKRSADFYTNVFGWQTRVRGDGAVAFDDGVGQVSGTWVLGRAPATAVGALVYIMVDSADATVKAITAHGGTIVEPPSGVGHTIARFSDPDGNIFGVYQEPSK
jgi:predicted enzyme related to lactoylglutathione lyase